LPLPPSGSKAMPIDVMHGGELGDVETTDVGVALGVTVGVVFE